MGPGGVAPARGPVGSPSGWTSGQAAAVLSWSAAEASRLFAGRLKGFGVARWTEFLALAERGA